MHIAKHPDHAIAWEKTTFLDYDRNFYARRMKESLYIDIFSKTGTMNLEDGMYKNHCWNAIMPILRKEISENTKPNCLNVDVHLHFYFYWKCSFPQDIF